jgi:alkylation response protein AidB-like acyl-CoA dehydrogenase
VDFDFDETQLVIALSAADVLGAAATGSRDGTHPGDVSRSGAATGCGDFAGATAWQALAKAGLLALTLPDWLGGDGLGVLEAAVLLTEAGRQAVTSPALATIMTGTVPLVRWASRDLQRELLAGVGSGEVILTAAVREQTTHLPVRPATCATLRRGGWQVTGTKVGVPYAAQARWILVPASLETGGTAVLVVAGDGDGVSVVPAPAASSLPESTVTLTSAPACGILGGTPAVPAADIGPGPAAGPVADIYRLAVAGACAQADGAVAGALDLTTAYVAGRHQFGRPLAAFQAVAQQIADVYIASRTLHLAALSACWRLASGRDPDQDLDVAAYWLGTEAVAALRTCHQLHGGIGLDAGYPLHRYSGMVSDLARAAGTADQRLESLGARAAG